jgi:hypothetical protein
MADGALYEIKVSQSGQTARDAGFGGHLDALYEHVAVLHSVLTALVPAIPPASEL